MANEIVTWIQFTLNKNLEVLDLSFSKHGTYHPEAYYDLPNCVLSYSHLVELQFTQCKINIKKKSELEFLKTLYLNNVMLMDQLIDYIPSGCPMLEELMSWLCYGHKRLVLLNLTFKDIETCHQMVPTKDTCLLSNSLIIRYVRSCEFGKPYKI